HEASWLLSEEARSLCCIAQFGKPSVNLRAQPGSARRIVRRAIDVPEVGLREGSKCSLLSIQVENVLELPIDNADTSMVQSCEGAVSLQVMGEGKTLRLHLNAAG